MERADIHGLQEGVEMLHLGGDAVVALRILGHAVAEAIRRQHAEALAEISEDWGPGIGARPTGRPRPVNEKDHIAAADIVVTSTGAIHIDELGHVAVGRTWR